MRSSNDVGSRAEGFRLDLERVSLAVEVFHNFPRYIQENSILP